jgi:Ca-activated chloride channel family protein
MVPLLFLVHAKAGMGDLYALEKGYEAYAKGDYKGALEAFGSVDPPLLESLYGQASALYKLGAYKKAGRLFALIRARDPKIEQRILYNLGNCAAKLGRYESAIDYYAKALALGDDNDTLANLKRVILLREKRKSEVQLRANRTVKAASRSGGGEHRMRHGGKKAAAATSRQQGTGSMSASRSTRIGRKREAVGSSHRHPLGSKVYEMINKGYVHETKPW